MNVTTLPETMTALRVHALGEAPRVDEIPVPPPQAGEVLVRLAATVIARHDLDVARGSLPVRQPLPYVPGLEGAGRVAAVGPDVDAARFPTGALVRASGGGLGVARAGTWAGYVAAPAAAVRPVPEGLDPVIAAACGSVAFTAWAALHDVGAVLPEERLGVTGASGAVGSLVLQLAERHGVERVVAWVRSPERLRALPPGAEVVTDGGPAEPVDVLIDTVGGPLLPERLGSVRPGGRAVLLGYTAGTRVCFELPELMNRWVSLLPVNMQRHRLAAEIQERLVGDFAAGRLTVATDVVELPALAEAIARFDAGRATGRVVLRWETA